MASFKQKCDAILRDHSSGSTEILYKTIDALQAGLNDMSETGMKYILQHLNRLFFKHTGFAVLYHFINAFFLQVEKGVSKETLLKFTTDYLNQWKGAATQINSHFTKQIKVRSTCILVHSNSFSIHQLVQGFKQKGIAARFIQTMSEPGGEGKLQASKIKNSGFGVELIQDTDLGNFINEADMAILGADVVTKNDFINKTGTHDICKMMNSISKPVYVICDSRKIIDPDKMPVYVAQHLLNRYNNRPDQPDQYDQRNSWFETTSLQLVSAIVTESGLIKQFDQLKNFHTTSVSHLFNREFK